MQIFPHFSPFNFQIAHLTWQLRAVAKDEGASKFGLTHPLDKDHVNDIVFDVIQLIHHHFLSFLDDNALVTNTYRLT